MTEAEEKRRAGLAVLERYTDGNDIVKLYGNTSPFRLGLGALNRGTFTASEIERSRLSGGGWRRRRQGAGAPRSRVHDFREKSRSVHDFSRG